MPICLGKAAKDLRNRLKLSLRDAAVELGISYAYLCNVENGKSSPSAEVIERFHDAWGIDLYMFALAFHGDDRSAPESLQGPLKSLANGWRKHIDSLLKERAKESASCLTSAE